MAARRNTTKRAARPRAASKRATPAVPTPGQLAAAAQPPAPKRNEVPLAKRQAQAQRQGYVGDDAGDLTTSGRPGGARAAHLGPQLESGVTDAPGGHPDDPTTHGTVGAGR